jgi:CheY-like chemotaxis protein
MLETLRTGEELPRHAGAPQPPAATPAGRPLAGPETITGDETILVVEDEPTVRNSIRRILTRNGYTVLEAQHGVEALRMIREATGPIDLVLTDLLMPEMSGWELIATLRTWPEPPKILVLSGYDAQAELRGESLPAGTFFLAKPFTVNGMLLALRTALDAMPEGRR